jgi:hypothetical protein
MEIRKDSDRDIYRLVELDGTIRLLHHFIEIVLRGVYYGGNKEKSFS